MTTQIDRVISLGKPLAVIHKLVTAELLRQDKATWMSEKQEEYDLLFPATRDMTAEEKIVHDTEVVDGLETTIEREEDYVYPQVQIESITTEEVQVQETIDGEEVQKTITQEVRTPSNYVTSSEYINETRIITEAVEATYDEDGMILTEAVAEVTELVHPYVAKDVTDRVDAYIRQATLLSVVTMRQARLALLQSGLLATIETAITTGTDEAMKIEWEYATEIKRDWNSLVALTTALGMTSAELDDLFQLASTL